MLPDQDLEATDIKRKHMYHIQDNIIRRLQLGESERRIAQAMQIARGTVHKYSGIAREKGNLDKSDTQPSVGELISPLRMPFPFVHDLLLLMFTL
jgi:hypothetical protein